MALRFSQNRKEMLDLIRSSNLPKTAEDLYVEMGKTLDRSTIYRGLDFLAKKGLVKSIFFDGQTRYFFSIEGHTHFVYCGICHKIQTFDDCMADLLEERVQKALDFFIEDHVFFFTGICRECLDAHPRIKRDSQ